MSVKPVEISRRYNTNKPGQRTLYDLDEPITWKSAHRLSKKKRKNIKKINQQINVGWQEFDVDAYMILQVWTY